ncbi:TPA: hypothetical protein JHJ70_004754 [Serratia marcescens]|nr:hypothetical protein [Serratia marcescens]
MSIRAIARHLRCSRQTTWNTA